MMTSNSFKPSLPIRRIVTGAGSLHMKEKVVPPSLMPIGVSLILR